MEKVVADTDIVIDFLRTNAGLLPQLTKLQQEGICEVYFSSITIMELFAGEMTNNEIKMLFDLLGRFKVISFDQELAQFAGENKRGKKLTVHFADFIIGITSIYIEAKLVTRNKEHFIGIPHIKFY